MRFAWRCVPAHQSKRRFVDLRGEIEELPSGSLRVKVHAGIDPITPKRHYLMERLEAFIVDVALVRALHPTAEPMVNLTNVEASAGAGLLLSVGQARVLRYRLGNLLDMTKATRNGGRWT